MPDAKALWASGSASSSALSVYDSSGRDCTGEARPDWLLWTATVSPAPSVRALASSATSTIESRGWNDTRRVERQSLDVFPDVDLFDPRIK